eukprot:Sspe_Gene.26754::Locus_11257_Transcript_1_1_Confidence_1.000_Length_4694::g.26754::m.26754
MQPHLPLDLEVEHTHYNPPPASPTCQDGLGTVDLVWTATDGCKSLQARQRVKLLHPTTEGKGPLVAARGRCSFDLHLVQGTTSFLANLNYTAVKCEGGGRGCRVNGGRSTTTVPLMMQPPFFVSFAEKVTVPFAGST